MTDTTPTPRGPGRPPILTPELTDEIAQHVRTGNYIETAAACVNVTRQTLFEWLRTGRGIIDRLERLDDAAYDEAWAALSDHEQNKVGFSYAIQKADADWERIAVLRVNKAGQDGAWQADMTRLERRKPKRWGRREAVEVSGQVDGVRLEVDTTEQAVDAAQRLRDARTADLACDLIEALAGEPSDAGDDGNGTGEADE